MSIIFLFLNFLSTFLFSFMMPQSIFWFVYGFLVALDIVGLFIIFYSVRISIPDVK